MRLCAEVDLDAICHNIAQVHRKAGKAKVLAVIKANAYGHGALEVARALAEQGLVYGFAVATADEGVELRQGGIHSPILILGCTFEEQYETVLRFDLTQTVFQLTAARALSALAGEMGKTGAVHIKIDTGMGRIGLLPEAASVAIVNEICTLPHLKAEGIFTHFACADEADKCSANRQQAKFVHFLGLLDQAGIQIPFKHVCNSAAILDFDDRYFDLVRSGIMTYGIYPSDEVSHNAIVLRPAMALKSHVAFVKTIQPGDSVSYGSTYTANEQRVIATIPVGYGDGYPRSLSGKGRVLIQGSPAPIVGRVCMDQFMVDVTELGTVHQGDPVVLLGAMGENDISIEELARLSGGFTYELVCNINRRVPRIYFKNGQEAQTVNYLTETD